MPERMQPWSVYAALLNSLEPSVSVAGGLDTAAHEAHGSDPLTHLSYTAFERHGTALTVEPALAARLLELSQRAWRLSWDLRDLLMELRLIHDPAGEPTPLGEQALAEARRIEERGEWTSYTTNAEGQLELEGTFILGTPPEAEP